MWTWWIALAIVVYTAVVSVTVDMGEPRYRTPTDPLILLVIFEGAYMTFEALRPAREPARDVPSAP